MEAKTHWEEVYRKKSPSQVSWFQEHQQVSLRLIRSIAPDLSAHVIDVGGGAATLVDDLLEAGFRRLTVLDISGTALRLAQERLGARAAAIAWIEADIRDAGLPGLTYDVWHDRAVFHFLTEPGDRKKYVEALRHSLKQGGHAVMATFAPDGPPRCSGLDVVRYSPDSMLEEVGTGFTVVDTAYETHQTPAGKEQRFLYCCLRRS